jgi:hypothetical protein
VPVDSLWEQVLTGIVLIAAALTALGVLAKYLRRAARALWRFGEKSVRAFEIIERELTPNGGGSTYDIVRQDHARLAAVEGLAAQAAEKAEAARVAAERVEAQRRQDVAELRGAMSAMKGEVAQAAAERTADAFEVMAEQALDRAHSHEE